MKFIGRTDTESSAVCFKHHEDTSKAKPEHSLNTPSETFDHPCQLTVSPNATGETSDELLQKLTENMPGALFQVHLSSAGRFRITHLTKQFRDLTALEQKDSEELAISIMRMVHPDDQRRFYDAIVKSSNTFEPWSMEYRQRIVGGSYRWHQVWAKPEACKDGCVVYHGYAQDIDQQVKTLKKLETLTYQDQVTGLPNRECFIRHIDELKNKARNFNSKHSFCSVCIIDLDNFKHINDTYGHEIGDNLLTQVGKRIARNLSEDDFLARLGGDEFAICLHNIGLDHDDTIVNTDRMMRRLADDLALGFETGVATCAMTASIGITLFQTHDDATIEEIFKQADMTVYEAKKTGKNNYLFHDAQNHHAKQDNFRIRSDLITAAKREEFKLEFQPQVDRLGRIVACEALIRWDHPQFGRIMPDSFIKFAEENGQIEAINKWVARSAVDTLAEWKNHPVLSKIMISVNLNAEQLLDLNFAETLINYFPAKNADPSKMMIEITEHGVASEIKAVAKRMKELKENGLRFSLDDFGTGYSSLSQLRMLPVDELKIDGSFISTINEDVENAKLVKAIFGMAEALNLKTVAEQVSDMAQFELLCKYNCDLFQGFLFSRSLSKRDFEEFVIASSSSNGISSVNRAVEKHTHSNAG